MNLEFGKEFWNRWGERPGRALAWFTAISSVFWIVQTSLCQRILPLDVIEAIVWGSQWQWGQMKSPPLSGYLAYAFSRLSGRADWSLYLLAQLCIVSGIYFTYRLAREFFEETQAALAALLLFFLYYYMPPAMKFCSHGVEVALLPAVGYFFWKALKYDRLKDWLLAALFAALATLGKYAALQLMAGCFVYMVSTRDGRKRFVSFKPWLALAGYLLCMTPHICWLFQHDFLPFRHIGGRLSAPGYDWTIPVGAVATMLFPYLLFAVLLAVADLTAVRRWDFAMAEHKELLREKSRRGALGYSLALTLIPEAFYLLPALAGHSIILMWFSYLASFCGITAAALLPARKAKRIFKILLAAVWIYFGFLAVGVTVDVLLKPRYRIHTEPEMVAEMAETYFRNHAGREASDRKIPVVYGDRWLAGVVFNYSSHHPPVCEEGDVCDMALYREKIRNEGALVIFNDRRDLAGLCRELGVPEAAEMEEYSYRYISQFGRSRGDILAFGWIPPAKPRAGEQ